MPGTTQPDTDKPVITLESVNQSSWHKDAPIVKFKVTDNGAIKEVKVNNTTLTVGADGFYAFSANEEGNPASYQITATDANGNTATQQVTIYLDMTVPTVTAKVDDNNQTKVIITATDTLSSIAKVEANATDGTPASVTKETNGTYTFTGTAGTVYTITVRQHNPERCPDSAGYHNHPAAARTGHHHPEQNLCLGPGRHRAEQDPQLPDRAESAAGRDVKRHRPEAGRRAAERRGHPVRQLDQLQRRGQRGRHL